MGYGVKTGIIIVPFFLQNYRKNQEKGHLALIFCLNPDYGLFQIRNDRHWFFATPGWHSGGFISPLQGRGFPE
jgi:hypothetical protein